VVELN